VTGARLRMLACAATVAACGQPSDEACVIGDVPPVQTARLGCAADHEAMGALEVDNVFSRSRSVNVIVDREAPTGDDGAIHFFDPDVYLLHYEFATAYLQHPDRTAVGSLADFNLLNYRRPQRRFFLGKVVYYADSDLWTFELAAGDNMDAALLFDAYHQIAGALGFGARLVYRPVSSDQADLLPELAAQGVPTVTTEAVFSGQTYQALNPGVAFGTLRFRRTDSLGGEPLAPTDLVVLDRVPNDVSMVAGIVTGEFQTPLAHVGILAKTRGTPNMALRDAFTDQRLRAFEGQLVRLEVGPQDFAIEGGTLAEAQAYWDGLRPSAAQVPQHDSVSAVLYDVGSADVDDIVRIGAKAAHLGELGRVVVPGAGALPLPPLPLAVPFHFYAQHLADHGVDAMIDDLLVDYGAGALTQAQLEQRLFAIRWAIYAAPVDEALLANLTSVATTRWGLGATLRFRSSTNVEDLAEFTGAGIYTSAGATLTEGPDAGELLARALRVVWASVWNTQAFIERDFYRVDQHEVRMAVLVHPNQEDELANGVALTINEFSELRPAFYINSQLGEVSVTNPTGDAVPEQILYYPYYEEPEIEVISRSSLMSWAGADWPAGDAILTRAEAEQLGAMLAAIAGRFRALYGAEYATDVEWKLMPGRELLIKQARPFRTRQLDE
jgi:pyruvate,water dikinase